MKTVKRKFKCTGCGIDRPCFIESNQEPQSGDYMQVEDLKCVLDETNQTSYNWEEINHVVESNDKVLTDEIIEKECNLQFQLSARNANHTVRFGFIKGMKRARDILTRKSGRECKYCKGKGLIAEFHNEASECNHCNGGAVEQEEPKVCSGECIANDLAACICNNK